MKKRKKLFIYPIIVVGVCLLHATSYCQDEKNIIMDIDGNVYHTVTIGTQVWTVENLKTTKFNNGDPLKNVTDNNEWSDLETNRTDAYCNYGNDESYVSAYGRLYNWFAVNDSLNIAPIGWHIPTNDEWIILVDYLIENGYNFDSTVTENKIAKSLASTIGWELSNITGAPGTSPEDNNNTGFTALPGGFRLDNGAFNGICKNGYWWCSREGSYYNAYIRSLSFNYNYLYYSHCAGNGYSVRCVKD